MSGLDLGLRLLRRGESVAKLLLRLRLRRLQGMNFSLEFTELSASGALPDNPVGGCLYNPLMMNGGGRSTGLRTSGCQNDRADGGGAKECRFQGHLLLAGQNVSWLPCGTAELKRFYDKSPHVPQITLTTADS
ncbi:MAG: hypothetical protein ACYDD1_01410 [Caulobacteraceae bacterium]